MRQGLNQQHSRSSQKIERKVWKRVVELLYTSTLVGMIDNTIKGFSTMFHVVYQNEITTLLLIKYSYVSERKESKPSTSLVSESKLKKNVSSEVKDIKERIDKLNDEQAEQFLDGEIFK